jgi:hypothetical protein
MAKVEVSHELVAQQIFPSLDVNILSVTVDHERQTLVFEVEGDSVPGGTEFATCLFTMTLGDMEPKRILKGEMRPA